MTTAPTREQEIRHELSFWGWLARSGLRQLWDRWLALHLLVGTALALIVPHRMSAVAASVFLPLASILVGLTFAWGGNALAALQTPELRKVATAKSAPGYAVYLHTYLLAIFVILVTLVLWGLLALGITDSVDLLYRNKQLRLAGRVAAFGLTSMAIRECWQVIYATHAGLIVRHLVQTEQERISAQQQAAVAEHHQTPSR